MDNEQMAASVTCGDAAPQGLRDPQGASSLAGTLATRGGVAPQGSQASQGSQGSQAPCEPIDPQARRHEATSHAGQAEHHHHSHASGSHHPGGHHLLQVEHLSVGFRMYEESASDETAHGHRRFSGARQREAQVISDLSISVHAGEIIAVVGASGSGKTLLADAIMGLFEPNSIVAGRIWFDGEELDAAGLRALRGNGISLVPQSVANLDPLMKVGRQVEGFAGSGRGRGRAGLSKAQRRQRRRELFARYGLSEETAELYPFELSGGMARRVLLCCALMDDPQLIIADEPTPGLDLDLALAALADLRAFADAGGGVMLITHDIELALRVADRVAVFRDGTVIEETDVASFAQPETLRHPFSRALWRALPEHDFAPEAVPAAEAEGAPETPASQNGGSPC